MNDLNDKIAEWRKGLETELMSAESLDELESHLRDDIDILLSKNHGDLAFDLAVHRFGDSAAVQKEYAKSEKAMFVANSIGIVGAGAALLVRALSIVGLIVGGIMCGGGLWYEVQLGMFLSVYGFPSPQTNVSLYFRWLVEILLVISCAFGMRECWYYLFSRDLRSARAVFTFNAVIIYFWASTILIYHYQPNVTAKVSSSVAILLGLMYMLFTISRRQCTKPSSARLAS